MTLSEFLDEWHNASPYVSVHTSGSTGKPKKMLVEKARMMASAEATCHFLGLKSGDKALLCMSLDYIAGKMMVVRSLVAGLRLITVEADGHPLASVNDDLDFVAMVPLQLYNTMQVPGEKLKLDRVKHTIIGGGAIDAELEKSLGELHGHLWSSYGMTETLSHIALRALNGTSASPYYTPFAGVQLHQDKDGALIVDAPRICATTLYTNDIVEIHADGTFRVLGRRDNMICSGGIKIQMEEVEAALSGKIDVPFAITSLKDAKFGEVVTLVVEDRVAVSPTVFDSLPKYWQPKHILLIDRIPLTDTGKIRRAELKVWAERQISTI